MHELVVQTSIRPEAIARAIRMYEGMLTLFIQQDGFRSATMLVDRRTGHGILNMARDTEAHMKAFSSMGMGTMLDVLSPVLVAPPTWKGYERTVSILA